MTTTPALSDPGGQLRRAMAALNGALRQTEHRRVTFAHFGPQPTQIGVPVPVAVVRWHLLTYIHAVADEATRALAAAALTAPPPAAVILRGHLDAISTFTATLPPVRPRRTLVAAILTSLLMAAMLLYLVGGRTALAAYAPMFTLLGNPTDALGHLDTIPAPRTAGLMLTNLAYLAALPAAALAFLNVAGKQVAASALGDRHADVQVTAGLREFDAPAPRFNRWEIFVAVWWAALAIPVVTVAVAASRSPLPVRVLDALGCVMIAIITAHRVKTSLGPLPAQVG